MKGILGMASCIPPYSVYSALWTHKNIIIQYYKRNWELHKSCTFEFSRLKRWGWKYLLVVLSSAGPVAYDLLSLWSSSIPAPLFCSHTLLQYDHNTSFSYLKSHWSRWGLHRHIMYRIRIINIMRALKDDPHGKIMRITQWIQELQQIWDVD